MQSMVESARVAAVAMGQVFALVAIGFWLQRRGWFTTEVIGALTRLSIDVALPALAVVSLVKREPFTSYGGSWSMPLLFVGMLAVGLAVGWVFSRGLPVPERRAFAALVGFPNAGYLPLPIAAALLPAAEAREAYTLIFLFILGFGPMMWSLGVWLLIGHRGQGADWTECLTPPLIATIVALALVAVGWDRHIPDAVLQPMRWLGDCVIPLVMLVLGGILGEFAVRRAVSWGVLTRLTVAKLIVMPCVILVGLRCMPVDRLVAFVLVIEAAVPPATSLAIIARRYSASQELLIAQGMVVTYLASVITVPCFLALSGLLGR